MKPFFGDCYEWGLAVLVALVGGLFLAALFLG